MCEREMSMGTVRGMTGGELAGAALGNLGGGRGGLLSPLRFLMKICIVSVGSGEAELERERDTMLSAWEVVERELVVVVWFVVVLRVLADGCGLVMGSRVELRGRRLSNKVSEVARFGVIWVTRWLFVMLRFMR